MPNVTLEACLVSGSQIKQKEYQISYVRPHRDLEVNTESLLTFKSRDTESYTEPLHRVVTYIQS